MVINGVSPAEQSGIRSHSNLLIYRWLFWCSGVTVFEDEQL